MTGNEAYTALMNGARVRLPDWPPGQYLKYRPKTFGGQTKHWIAVYREHRLSHHNHKASGREFNSEAWQAYELPAGVTEEEE